MKTKNLKEKGITLIALVITIIVLLILAGVTISIVMKTGIMDKAEKAVDMYSEQEVLEQLKIALLDYKAGTIMKENKELLYYIQQIDPAGTVDEKTDPNNYIIEMLGYEFIVDKETLEIVNVEPLTGPVPEITSIGKAPASDNTYVIITVNVKPVNTGANLTITVNGENVEKTGDNTFKIKKDGTYKVIVKEENIKRKAKGQTTISGIVPITYTVSVTKNLEDVNATITGGGEIEKGESTTITISAVEEGYRFIKWVVKNGTVTGVEDFTTTSITFTPTGDTTIEAKIAPPDTAGATAVTNHSPNSLDTISWGTLTQIANLISGKTAITNDTEEVTIWCDGEEYTIGVGDTKTVNFNGGVKGNGGTYTVRILGFNHDLLKDETTKTAGISFEFAEILEDLPIRSSNTNTNGWIAETSTNYVYPWLNDSNNGVYKKLQEQNSGLIIRPVKRIYSSTSICTTSTVNGIYLWLLGASNIFEINSYGNYGDGYTTTGKEGEIYKYYKTRNTRADRIKEKNGEASDWWFSSSKSSNTAHFVGIKKDGSSLSDYPTKNYGVSPGFSI